MRTEQLLQKLYIIRTKLHIADQFLFPGLFYTKLQHGSLRKASPELKLQKARHLRMILLKALQLRPDLHLLYQIHTSSLS